MLIINEQFPNFISKRDKMIPLIKNIFDEQIKTLQSTIKFIKNTISLKWLKSPENLNKLLQFIALFHVFLSYYL